MAKESDTWIMHGVAEDDAGCIHTVEEAISYINQIGFLPLFRNEIPGFSLEERTVPEYWWSDDALRDPWQWRKIIARSGKAAYGRFFAGKAGFISLTWLPYFANYRRDGYDFDALWDDEKASIRQKKIMDLFEEEDGLYSFEVKQKAGFGKGGEKNFEETVAPGCRCRPISVSGISARRRIRLAGSMGWMWLFTAGRSMSGAMNPLHRRIQKNRRNQENES